MPQHLNHRSPRRRQKETPWGNTWRDNSWKLPCNGGGNSHPSLGNSESPKQDKPEVKHPKTRINQINKDQTQGANIKSSKRKDIHNTQGDSHKDNSWSFNRNSSGQKGMARHTWSDEIEKPTIQITVPRKDLIQILWRDQKLYRQEKAENSAPTNKLFNKC